MISSIVVLYEPKIEECTHICDYYMGVDIVYVIDNSKENYKASVEQALIEKYNNIEKLHYFHFPENIGLCKALNFGIRQAKEAGCDWALLMDAESSFITDIVSVYRYMLNKLDSDVAVLAPVHIHDRSSASKYEGERIIKWAMTSGCLYNISTFEKMEGFKEELFVDGLDIDYCYKVREAGYKVLECGRALLRHHPASTKEFVLFGKAIFKYGVSSPERYKMQARSLVWLIRRYKQFPDVVRYCWKWVKVVLFFNEKGKYIYEMKVGSKEGLALVRMENRF